MSFKNQTLDLLICVQIKHKVLTVTNSLCTASILPQHQHEDGGSGNCWFGFCAHQSHPGWRLTGLGRPGAQLLLATAENLSP